MRQETAQCQAHLDPVDAHIRAARNAGAQDMDRQRDHDALMLRKL